MIHTRHSNSMTMRRGFSLIEVLLSIFILSIGIISIATLFPAGIAQQQRSVDEVMGPVVANNALGIIRAHLEQEDFGSLEDHMDVADFGTWSTRLQRAWSVQSYTTFGDWPWTRPGVMTDDPGTDRDETGYLDIFNLDPVTQSNPNDTTSEYNSSDPLLGIPFNIDRYGTSGFVRPAPVIGLNERFYPNVPTGRDLNSEDRPQYVWECMFRKFQGRVQVAIFVFRVTAPPGRNYLYDSPTVLDPQGVEGPLPMRYKLVSDGDVSNGSTPWPEAWDIDGADCGNGFVSTYVPGTCPGDTFSINDPTDSWQRGEQWLLDQNANIHRVLVGRRTEDDGPVELQRNIPAMPNTGVFFFDPNPASGNVGGENVVTDIWFIPRVIPVDLDGNGSVDNQLAVTPIYVSVKEL